MASSCTSRAEALLQLRTSATCPAARSADTIRGPERRKHSLRPLVYFHHKFDHEFVGSPAPTRSLVVCSSPRSGSSLLCEYLCLSGRAGAPTEFFDDEQMARFAALWGTRGLDEYVAALLARKTSPNGVFATKLHFGQFTAVLAQRRLEELFPGVQYVWMTRRDRVRQALSFARALQTQQWASMHKVQAPATYDRALVERMLARVAQEDDGWRAWFERHGITPLRVEYEELVEAPRRVLERVLATVGEDARELERLPEPTLQRQADDESERWAARWRSELDTLSFHAASEPRT